MPRISSPADIEAMERTRLSARDLPPSTYAALERGANANLDKIALQFFLQGTDFGDAVFFTYRDLMGLINQAANLFHELGIGPQDVVSLILPNLPQAYFATFGAQAAGIANPIDHALEPAHMADIMNAAGTRVLVTLAPFPGTDVWARVAAAADAVPTLETILTVDLVNYLPTVSRWVGKLLGGRGKADGVRAHVLDFGKVTARCAADRLAFERTIQPGDTAVYFHTAGAFGSPKLARQTHFNQVFDAWATAQLSGFRPKHVMLGGLPLSRPDGLLLTGLLPWMTGASQVLGPPNGYSSEGVVANFWHIVDFFKVNTFCGDPALFEALVGVDVGEADISTLAFALCTPPPLPAETLRLLKTRMQADILQSYGLTEATCISTLTPPATERCTGSLGLRLPYQQMKVITVDAAGEYLRDTHAGKAGLLVVRGPNVFPGYKDAAHAHRTWIDCGDGRGPWLNTGDWGRQDENGCFWLAEAPPTRNA